MALDPYKLCPCGGGKKVKFCCCKDIVNELDDVLRVLEGEQRLAGLEKLNKLIASKGERAALLALKGDTQIQLGQVEAAKSTVGSFVVRHPDNPVALAQSALLEIVEHNLLKAVTALQRAMEALDRTMPGTVYMALGALGEALLADGNILAGRSHLLLQTALNRTATPRAALLLQQLHGASEISLLLKENHQLAERPAEAAWGQPFDAAMKWSERGAWLAAVEQLEILAQEVPGQPAILKNIAILRSYLGDAEATALAWRRYAQLDGIPLDDAVEAEALAQLLEPDREQDKVDLLTITYPIKDMAKLLERFAGDRRLRPAPVDPRLFTSEGQPPPKAAYLLLDRPLPRSGEQITRDAVPVVLGDLYLFGKQTDRGARLEFEVFRTEDFEEKTNALAELVGDLCDGTSTQGVTGQAGALGVALSQEWVFPEDTPPQVRSHLIAEQRRELILNNWPQLPLRALGGRRPRDVAAEPAYRVPLLAAILLLDLSEQAQRWPSFDYNLLRRQLGLPPSGEIDPTEIDVGKLPVVRLGRVQAEKLGDDDLLHSYARASQLGARTAGARLAHEVVRRPSLDEKVDKAVTYQILASATRDNEQAFQYIGQARSVAVAKGQSPAPWLIAELALRLRRGVIDRCRDLVDEIQLRHFDEPGVAQTLYDVLVRFGVIRPGGGPAGAAAERAPAGVLTGAPAAAGQQIVTPGGPAERPRSGGESKLWLPDQL